MKGKSIRKLLAVTLGTVMAIPSATAVYADSTASVASDNSSEVIYSSDFEDGDVSAFTNRGGNDTTVISASEDMAVSGTKSLCAGERSKSWNGPAFRLDDKCEPGTAYLVSAKVAGQWYTSVTVSFQYTDAGGEVHYENLANLNGNGFQEVNDLKVSFSEEQTDVYVYFEGGSDNIYIDDFSIKTAPVFHPESDIASLKDVYDGYFKIGTAVTTKELAPKSTKELILKHFNSITAGNELKPDAILDKNACLALAEEGDDTNPQINLASARSILNFARDNNIPVRGHVLVWHSQTPDWFFKENYADDGEWVSKEKMLSRMENYIKNVFTAIKEEYPDVDFYAWDVVNECWLDDGQPRKPGEQGQSGSNNSAWVQIFGDNSFIKPAFEFAKKYAPEGTKLYYNDFNEYMPQKTDAIIKMVEEINSDGHYIDGIGLQSHLDVSFPSVSVYKKALAKFCATGLDVQVTELDATTSDKSEEGFEKQAQYYSDIMDCLVEYKDNISSVVFWGTTDDQSWRASKSPLLFNEDYTAKPSFYSIIDGVEPLSTEPKTTTQTTAKTETSTTTTTTTTGIGLDEGTYTISGTVEKITEDAIIFSDNGSYTFANNDNFNTNIAKFADVKPGDKISVTFFGIQSARIIMKVDEVKVIGADDIVYGDSNGDGDVTVADAVLILQSLANPDSYSLTEEGRKSADVVGNDGVTANDALAIQLVEAKAISASDLPLDKLPE